MKSKFANLNLEELNVLSAEQKKGVTGGAYDPYAPKKPTICWSWLPCPADQDGRIVGMCWQTVAC